VHRNTFKTFTLLAGLAGLLVLFGRLVGGLAGAAIGLALGLALVAGSYWFSDRIAVRAARAVPLEDDRYHWLQADVAELAHRAGIPAPRLYLSPAPQPNAFATGRNERTAVVAVTAGLLERLPRAEVRAVLAHELGHIRNRDILIGSIAAAIATGISMLANLAMWSSFLGGDEDEGPGAFGVLLAALVAPIAAMLLQLAVSRSREYEADRTASELLGTGEPLARALVNIERTVRHTPMAVPPAQASAWIVNLAMWSSFLGGDDEDSPGVFGVLFAALVAPIAATLLQLAVSRSREYEADRTAAELLGTGEPLARALVNIERTVRTTPMAVPPAQASAWIVNPLTGRRVSFANLFQTHPSTEQRVVRLLGASAVPAR
jgi:heat shock protein HtpX